MSLLESYNKDTIQSYDATYYVNQGALLGKLGKYELALKSFNEALELDHDDPEQIPENNFTIGYAEIIYILKRCLT